MVGGNCFVVVVEGQRWCALENMVLVELELCCRIVSLGRTEPRHSRPFTSPVSLGSWRGGHLSECHRCLCNNAYCSMSTEF